jgi:hypothetical protein
MAAKSLLWATNRLGGSPNDPTLSAVRLEWSILTNAQDAMQLSRDIAQLRKEPETAKEFKDVVASQRVVANRFGNIPRENQKRLLGVFGAVLGLYPEKSDPMIASEVVRQLENVLVGDEALSASADILAGLGIGAKKLELSDKDKALHDRIMDAAMQEIATVVGNAVGNAFPIDATPQDQGLLRLREALEFLDNDQAQAFLSSIEIDAAQKPRLAGQWRKLWLDTSMRTNDWDAIAEEFLSGTPHYLDEIRTALLSESTPPVIVTKVLPVAYDMLDQGFMAKLWESSSKEKKMLIMQAIGERWPAYVLIGIAEGQDKELAAMAYRLLDARKQTHLLSGAPRDQEM